MTRAGLLTTAACGLQLLLPQQAPIATFRSGVDAVTVDVSVFQGNRAMHGLTAADFELTDNGVKQDLTASSLETLPIDLTLIQDVSGSVRNQIEDMRADVRAVAAMLKRDDRLRLLTFATHVSAPFGFLNGGILPRVELVQPGGATSFHNSLISALLTTPPADRRQLIVAFSDGLDTTSFLDATDVRSAAARTDAVLHIFLVRYYTVQHASHGWLPYNGEPDAEALRATALDTGGQFYRNPSVASVPKLVGKVLDEFRTSYVLRYTATGVAPSGWHDVAVRVTRPGTYTVRARKGYFAGPGGGK